MKHLRVIALGLIYVALGVLGLAWWSLLGRISSAPTQPSVVDRLTIPFNNHGETVFITPLQENLLFWLPVAFGVAAFVGVALTIWRPKPNPTIERDVPGSGARPSS